MKSLNDIVIDNAWWEQLERQAKMADKIRDLNRKARVPWQTLRTIWGDGPSNESLLRWWNACDATTRKMIDPEVG